MSPSKYIQASGAIEKLKDFASGLGSTFLVLASEGGMKRTRETVEKSFSGTDKKLVFEVFNKECCKKEINRLIDVCKANGIDCVIGIGGGKLLDTAKATAYYQKIPVVIVPSIASTDAPCSALSVIYTEDGVFEEYLVLPKNPEVVIMDVDLIANAPARFLVAGMGDALATYFEARACDISKAKNMAGLLPAKSAFALAKLCYETLLEDGYKAKLAVENNVVTPAVEAVIEANTYLSGIGFESGGLGSAHSIHNGLTVLPETHHLYHGEKVAFGVLAGLHLYDELGIIDEVYDFCIDVGLPVTFEDLHIPNVTDEELYKVAEISYKENFMSHEPVELSVEKVVEALKKTDEVGRAKKKAKGK